MVAALCLSGVGLLVLLWSHYQIRRRLTAIRRRVEEIAATGDPDLRVAQRAQRGLGRDLARSVDTLVAAALARCGRSERAQVTQDQHWRTRYVKQRLSEEYLTRQARAVIDESTGLTKTALVEVAAQAQAVLSTTQTIEDSVRSATLTTDAVVAAARTAATALGALEGSFQQVAGITRSISNLAEQTNRLSLNAAIEAVRAGTAGRGFGVVAQEVKALATETAQSAAQIRGTMGSLQSEVAGMVGAIGGVADSISQIENVSATVNTAVSGQRVTLEELEMCVHNMISQMDLLKMVAHNIDRRRNPRIAASGLIQLHCGAVTVHGDLLDVSEGGLQCDVEKSAHLSGGDDIAVTFDGDQAQHSMTARLVRRIEGDQRDRIALEFKGLVEPQREVIRECIASFLAVYDDANF